MKEMHFFKGQFFSHGFAFGIESNSMGVFFCFQGLAQFPKSGSKQQRGNVFGMKLAGIHNYVFHEPIRNGFHDSAERVHINDKSLKQH